MKRKLFSVIFLLIMICNYAYSQQDVNGWFWLNGQPTGNRLHWVKIIDAANIYAVGNFGTFMKSNDGGDTWSVNSQVGSPDNSETGGGSTLVLNTGWFFDANTGIVAGQSLGTSNGRISKTTNGGNTWTYYQYNDTGGTANGIYFINSNTGYLTGVTQNIRAMLFKTTNQGLTWTDLSNNIPPNTYNAVYARDENNIFLTTFSNAIVKTNNGGTSWTTQILPGSSTTITDIYFKDANTGYACGNGVNYFAYTINGGSSWTQSNAPATVGQRDLVYNAGTLYMAGPYYSIYKSVNNGVTWDSVYFHDASNVNQPIPFIIYALDANGSNIAVVGDAGTLNLSNDGGGSWRNKNYSVSNSNGLYGSERYNSIHVQSATGNIWLGPNGGGHILYSSNGGTNWTAQSTGHTTSIGSIEFVNSTTGFACGGNPSAGVGEFSTTANGGATWNLVSLPSPANSTLLTTLDFINANTGWIFGGLPFGGAATIAKTTDGGASWTDQAPDNGYSSTISAGGMADANTGYCVSGSSLFKTTNGGNNWVASTIGFVTSTSWSSMFLLNKDIIYLNGGGTSGLKRIVRSTDGGQNWVDLTSSLLSTATVFRTKWLNLNNGIVGGTNGYFAKTTNGGVNWTESNPGGSTLLGLSIPEKNSMFAVSDRNSFFEVWRLKDNQTSITVNPIIGIEGFWNGTTQVPDTITCYLRSSTSPYAVVDQAKSLLNIGGYGTFQFNSAPAGSYYIQIGHRNALETWSAAPIAMSAGGNYNYNFTTSASQAFGNNQVLKSGKYCFYSGEINKDGSINLTDMLAVSNAVVNFVSGYVPTDLDGNNVTNLTDLIFVSNNSTLFVSVKKP